MTKDGFAAMLAAAGGAADESLNLFELALCLSPTLNAPGDPPGQGPLRHQGQMLCDQVAARFHDLRTSGGADDARTRLAALKHVLSDTHDYRLDRPEAEAMEGADLARVIDRRRGLSTAIAILYIHAARAQGWDVVALSFPGYTPCRIGVGAEYLVFDPPRGCRLLEAPDLRAMVKSVAGPKAELSAHYHQALTNRGLLIRLQNAVKLRQIEMGDYAAALRTVEGMQTLDRREYRLFLDAGVLLAKTQAPVAAIIALEQYLTLAPAGRERQEALALLQELRAGLVS